MENARSIPLCACCLLFINRPGLVAMLWAMNGSCCWIVAHSISTFVPRFVTIAMGHLLRAPLTEWSARLTSAGQVSLAVLSLSLSLLSRVYVTITTVITRNEYSDSMQTNRGCAKAKAKAPATATATTPAPAEACARRQQWLTGELSSICFCFCTLMKPSWNCNQITASREAARQRASEVGRATCVRLSGRSLAAAVLGAKATQFLFLPEPVVRIPKQFKFK